MDFPSAFVFISVGGVYYAQSPSWPYGRPAAGTIDNGSLVITDILNETPNTCLFTMRGVKPTVGQEVIVTLGWKDNSIRLFAGTILTIDEVYVDTPAAKQWNVSAIDYTWQLGRYKVITQYANTSATAIAQDLIARYAPGFTSVHVQASLDVVALITFTNQDLASALTQLAKDVGCYWYVDYFKDVHFFVSETEDAPEDISSTHPSLDAYNVTKDLTKVITRCFVEGGGGSAARQGNVGDTSLVLDTTGWNNPAGGMVTSGTQRITYTGIGQAYATDPPAAWTAATPASGLWTAICYAQGLGLFVAVANGVAMTSPDGQAWTSRTLPTGSYNAVVWAPALSLLVAVGSSGKVATSPDGITWTARTAAGTSETWLSVCWSPALALFVAVGVKVTSFAAMTSPDGVTWTGRSASVTTNSWVSVVWADSLNLFVAVANNTSPAVMTSPDGLTWTSRTGPASLTAVAWSSPLTRLVALSGTTVYTSPDGLAWTTHATAMSSANWNGCTWLDSGWFVAVQSSAGSHGNLLSYSADGISWTNANTTVTTTWNAVAWAPNLGTAVAVGENGLTGSVMINTIALLAALTGIPASGPGSILYPVLVGDQVNLVVQVDDLAAQAALKTYLDPTGVLGYDGVIEDYLSDGRIGESEALAQGVAELELLSTLAVSITYTCRDPLTRSGKSVYVSILDIEGWFQIQQVTITAFSMNEYLFPTFSVQLSVTRFTFEDLLRVARLAA